jgi:hypothetical protein
MQNSTFTMRRFGAIEEVKSLRPGEALLVHKYLIRRRYQNARSAEAAVRQVANGSGAHLWVTTTKRGHVLIYRKLAEPTPVYR